MLVSLPTATRGGTRGRTGGCRLGCRCACLEPKFSQLSLPVSLQRICAPAQGSLELGESEEDDPELAGLVTGEGAAGGDSGTEQLDRNDSRTSQSSVASGHGQLRRHPSILKVTPATIVPKLSGEKTPSLCTTVSWLSARASRLFAETGRNAIADHGGDEGVVLRAGQR